jgi:glyoxylase-like metal-dependent hydrolase (beta-lactamase superfamily II)
VLVTSFPAEVFGTNCYVVASNPDEQCVVIDPGIGVLDQLDEVLAEYRLTPAAVLLTHGHLDHTFSVAPVCGARGITAYVHPGDLEMLADPAKGLSMSLDQLFGGRIEYSEPEDVTEMRDGQVIEIAGLSFTVSHAPGHTNGSVMFQSEGDEATTDGAPLCFTGDVLFAGSIGRTDLPGGDTGKMMVSLRDKVLTLPDEMIVLPGHGPTTTIGRERATNPFLREVSLPAATQRGW